MIDLSSKPSNTHLSFPSLPTNDHSDSGVCSPTLWTTTTPPRHHRPEEYWSLSPESKAKAIARGQRELMEMVSKMPESCYELSLRDIVEVKRNEGNDGKVFDELPKRRNMPRKKKNDKRIDVRLSSGGNGSGFLLNMMFPVSLGSKKSTVKKKKKVKRKEEDCQVSPRRLEECVKGEDRDWWNWLSDSRGSSCTKRSGSSSSNSSSKSRISKMFENGSCLSFLWRLHSRD